MSVKDRVEDARFLFENGSYEGAFLNALVAVAASARKETPSRSIGDKDCFIGFIESRQQFKLSVEYRGKLFTIAQIFYKWFRCELVHEGGLPVDIEFIETSEMKVRAGGKPNYILKVSYGWFHWLIKMVVEAPCNESEFLQYNHF